MRQLVLPLSLFACLSLVACGGGGSDPAPFVGGTSSTSVGGVASKGVIRNALIELHNLSGDLLGSVTTNDDGEYTIELNDTYTPGIEGGVVIASLSNPGSATMVCDLQGGCGGAGFGEELPLPLSFEMKAIFPFVAGAFSRSITPYTHLAYHRALEIAADDETQISLDFANDALTEVGNMLGGIDILRSPIPDLTDAAAIDGADNSTAVYAALAASVMSTFDAANPEDALADLVAAFEGGVIDSATLESIIDNANAEMTERGIADETGLLAAMQQSVDNADGGDVDPQPNPVSSDSAVQQAKVLISDLRGVPDIFTFPPLADLFDGEAQDMTTASAVTEAVAELGDGGLAALFAQIDSCYRGFADSDDNGELDYLGPTSCDVDSLSIVITADEGGSNDDIVVTGSIDGLTIDDPATEGCATGLCSSVSRSGGFADNANGDSVLTLTGIEAALSHADNSFALSLGTSSLTLLEEESEGSETQRHSFTVVVGIDGFEADFDGTATVNVGAGGLLSGLSLSLSEVGAEPIHCGEEEDDEGELNLTFELEAFTGTLSEGLDEEELNSGLATGGAASFAVNALLNGADCTVASYNADFAQLDDLREQFSAVESLRVSYSPRSALISTGLNTTDEEGNEEDNSDEAGTVYVLSNINGLTATINLAEGEAPACVAGAGALIGDIISADEDGEDASVAEICSDGGLLSVYYSNGTSENL